MNTWLVLLSTVLSAVSALGQDAKANVTPPEVEAGKDITVTVMVDRPPSIGNARINVTIAPKELAGNPSPFVVGVFPKNGDSKILSNMTQVPPDAKGIWYVRDAYTQINGSSTPIVLSDHPEFKVRPIEIVLPRTGSVTVTIP